MINRFKAGNLELLNVVAVLLMSCALVGCNSGNSQNSQASGQSPFGLDARPTNLSCTAPSRPAESSGVTTDLPFPFLNLDGLSVTSLFQPNNDLSHWYFTSRLGKVYVFENSPAVSSFNVVLDLSDRVSTYYGELGLLNAVLHPNFPEDPRIFVYYIGLGDIGDAHLSSFTTSDGGETFDLDSERIILTLPQVTKYHKGGGLVFDDDGNLLFSIGDGGVSARAEDPWSLYGSLIRIDVDSAIPYGIPPDNPYVITDGGAPEVLAYGLRNPWRFSIDRQTGEIWLGDVGASGWEEVNRIHAGGNYGWPIREGAHCSNVADDVCDSTNLTDPIFEYSHDVGLAIIGGYVYRGSAIPSLVGKYIYADYTSGMIWALEHNGDVVVGNQELTAGVSYIQSFSQNSHGELYVVRSGQIRRLVPVFDSGQDQTIPKLLSETGCFEQNDPTVPLKALIPYDVNAEFWSDGADKKRWMAVPDGQYVDIDDAGDFLFPVGTVLIKEFSINNKRIETRFLVRYDDDGWGGYTYLWNDDETDAELLREGTEFLVGDQLYTIPNEYECAQCHTDVANDTLGPEVSQLNRSMFYESTGRNANQLSTLEHIGFFSRPLPNSPDKLEKLSSIDDATQSAEERIRSYLHANCSQCHRPGGIERTSADFRYAAEKGMGVCDREPLISDLGIDGAKLIAPGHPDRSIVLARIKKLGASQMPPIARNVLHAEAIGLLEEYIGNLETCD